MSLYTLADTHLSLSVNKPMDIFGARWKNHTEKISVLWNKTVTDADTVVIGGDISWGMTAGEAAEDLKFIDALNGKKILMRGNHDYWWSTLSKVNSLFGKENITTVSLLQNNAIPCEGFVICGTRGWYSDPQSNPRNNCDHEKIVARETARLKLSLECASKLEGEKIAFMHFPPVFTDYVCRPLVDLLHEYGIKRCYYGHIHGSYALPPRTVFEGISFYIVSADYLDFRPKLIEHSNC